MAKIINTAISLLLLTMSVSADWAIIGAGNATCKDWIAANTNSRTEILSWMLGFASAQNLYFASTKQPEYRLELLTDNYLVETINSYCIHPENSKEQMSEILFGILMNLPRSGK